MVSMQVLDRGGGGAEGGRECLERDLDFFGFDGDGAAYDVP